MEFAGVRAARLSCAFAIPGLGRSDSIRVNRRQAVISGEIDRATTAPVRSGNLAAPGRRSAEALGFRPASDDTAAAPMPRTRSYALLAVTIAR